VRELRTKARWFAPQVRAGCCLILVLACAAGISRPRGENLYGYAELVAGRLKTSQTGPFGGSLASSTDGFSQKYSVTFDRSLFPNFRLLVGGFFERNDSELTTNVGPFRSASDSTTTRLRPFLELRLRSRLFLGEATWNRNEQRLGAGTLSFTTVRQTYSAAAGWYPDGFPSVKLQWLRTESFDKERTQQNIVQNVTQLFSDYRPLSNLTLYYRGVLDDTEDKINGNTLENSVHSGKASYFQDWRGGRTSFGISYDLTYRQTTTATAGTGELAFPLVPLRGLSAISDTPDLGPLVPNPTLIDGNRTAGAGVDVGLTPPAGDDRPRNIGLDFAVPVQINALRVWVDRDLRPEVSTSFSWAIYVSANNRDWQLHQVLASAPFDPFEPRFELRFRNTTARYVKVVTRPLAAGVPFASDYPNILITEIEPFLRRLAGDLKFSASGTTHLVNADFRTQILAVPMLFYELTYFLRDVTQAASTYTLSNGFSLSHQFDPVWSTSARVSREDGREIGNVRTAYVYSAAVTAVPVERLRHNLVVSGKMEDIGAQSEDSVAVFLYSTAGLYEGIDVNLGVGKSVTTRLPLDERVDGQRLDLGASFVPHPTVTVSLTYQGRTDERRLAAVPGTTVDLTRAGELGVSWTPVRMLYMFGALRREKTTRFDWRTLRSYALTWTPFPDGNLRFAFNYSDDYLPELEGRQRAVIPSLRWQLTPRWYFDFSYQKLTTESRSERIDTEIAAASMRIAF
jgi:hypothetical protein